MGVHSEAELQGIESTEGDIEAGEITHDQIESLRTSASAITRELQILGEKVGELVASIEAIGPAPAVKREAPAAAKKQPESVPVSAVEEEVGTVMTVIVSPLPELAMAAVAETTLRNLPSVRQVSGVKREGGRAAFTLDVDTDADLIAEMKTSMPVSFTVDESSEDRIALSLQWAWGAS